MRPPVLPPGSMGIVQPPHKDKLTPQIVPYVFYKPYSYFLIFRKKKLTTIPVPVEIGKFFIVFRIREYYLRIRIRGSVILNYRSGSGRPFNYGLRIQP